MTFALIAVDGTITEISAAVSPDEIRAHIGGWMEDVPSKDGSGISAYVDEEARLKTGIVHNPLASVLIGEVLLGPAVIVGGYDPETDTDIGLTSTQWAHIREVAAAVAES